MEEGILFSTATPSAEVESAFHEWSERTQVPSRLALEGFDVAERYELAEGWDGPRFAVRYHITDISVLSTPAYRRLRETPDPEGARIQAASLDLTQFAGRLIGRDGQTWDPKSGSLAYVLTFGVPQESWDELERWFADEHAPMLLEEPKWLGCERFRTSDVDDEVATPRRRTDPDAWRPTHLIVHVLEDITALDSPARTAARETDWRKRLAGNAWHRDSVRWLFRPLGASR